MLLNHYFFRFILTGFCFCCSYNCEAQLRAYGGKQTDNNCKTIYLVNPSADSIYYITGVKDIDISRCQTYELEPRNALAKCTINISGSGGGYFLLLPKDTLAYNIIMSCSKEATEKHLMFMCPCQLQ